MAFIIIALSLFHDTHELEKTQHLVVANCGCVNKLVGDIVNLAQIPKHIVQMFTESH